MALVHLACALLLCFAASWVAGEEPECSWEDRDSCGTAYRDPKLETMTYDLDGDGQDESCLVYIDRDVATFYNQTPGSIKPKETYFKGMFGKFINMSKNKIRIMWKSQSGPLRHNADISPFESASTATYPGHIFLVTDPQSGSPKKALKLFKVREGNSLHVYDPYGSKEAASSILSEKEMDLYKLQWRNLAFNKVYQRKTNRQWIALYGRKRAPRSKIWPADFFGQTHVISTTNTYVTKPLSDDIGPVKIAHYGATDEQRRSLSEFLEPASSPNEKPVMNLTMTVLSVAPRVFEIRDFLSKEEIHHIMEIKAGSKLTRSTTRAGGSVGTRTSTNSWIGRERSEVIDLIYRRAADILQIDEQLFRYRKHDVPGMPYGKRGSIAERLQLVYYAPGNQYTAHHDFSMPDLRDGQPSRFATILFYLNDVESGGETSFPRWLNGETHEALKVKPEPGKAILFYNQLPDGNYDERSQHAALPVLKGEKHLMNLWVWDPFLGIEEVASED